MHATFSPLSAKKVAQLTGHNASIFALALSDTPRYCFSGAGDGWVVRWDLDAPDLGHLVAKIDTQIFSLLYLTDYHKIIAGSMQGGVHWIDLDAPDRTKNIAHHGKGVFAVFRVGESVFTIGGEGKITRWAAAEARSIESVHLSNQSLRSADFNAPRNEIAIGSSDNAIYLLDATSLALKRTLAQAHANSVFAVRYSPNGRYLLSGGRDAQLIIRDTTRDFQPVFNQPAHWFTINDIVFQPDGSYFATASRDKTIKIWEASTFQLLKVLETVRDGGHIYSVNRLLWTPHQQYLLSASDDRSLKLWQITT